MATFKPCRVLAPLRGRNGAGNGASDQREGLNMDIEYDNQTFSVYLCDDGTLDTVISVDGVEHRFDCEYASQFRNDDGSMTTHGLVELAIEAIESDERHWG